jgi:hypothetical protein
MTTATWRHSTFASWALAALAVATLAGTASALPIDERGEMKLGMRAYTALRLGTEKIGGETDPLNYPGSAPGSVRQHRYFLQLDFDHDLTRIAHDGWGPARLFGLLDNAFDSMGWQGSSDVKYTVQYRGEGEGIYDYGPSEYSDAADHLRKFRLNTPEVHIDEGPPINVHVNLSRKLPEELIRQRVDKLRRIARQRHRLFLAYLDWERGPVFLRVGRQILAWGETDVFRLLDNINPLDDSFGGFFIALDERRLPIEMIRGSYRFGDFGPLQDGFVEAFAATGKRVATFPGIPNGSPWSPGGIASPNPSVTTVVNGPDATDIRGGARMVFTVKDVTATLAHYYTYLDVPGVRFTLPGARQCPGEAAPTNTARFCNPIIATQDFPRVPISGLSVTFPVPSFYTIIRSEAAYFQDEPMNRQGRGNSNDTFAEKGTPGYRRLVAENNTEGGLNPFVWPRFIDPATTRIHPLHGQLLQRDTFNMAVGADINRFIRWLNPTQTFFFTTQLFYKHVFDSPGDLILPVPFRNTRVGNQIPVVGTKGPLNGVLTGVFGANVGCGTGTPGRRRPCKLQPRFLKLNDDRFLQTLLITTSYSGGRVVPVLGMFYDWQGAIVFQPGVQLVRDPFRFIFDYTRIEGAPTGQFGAVRDRDNVRFQVEFVF